MVGHGFGVWWWALERAAKGAKEWQQLSDGGQGALSKEGELQMLCARFLTQPIQYLKKTEQDIEID